MQKLHFSTETVKQTWMEESFINYMDIVCPLLKLSFLEIWLGIIAIIVTNLSLASKPINENPNVFSYLHFGINVLVNRLMIFINVSNGQVQSRAAI